MASYKNSSGLLILGIDPGSRVTGYGLVNSTGTQQQYVTSGCIRTTDKATLPEKLDEIFCGVTQIINEYVPHELAIEQIFMARSAESALKLGHARGVAMVAAVTQGLPVYEYEARKVKQAVVGSGAARKEQVQHMVQVLLKLPGKPQADAADALAVALCHINTLQGLGRLPGSKDSSHRFSRGRLKKVEK
jgi:crossover junction endodeoxyribonuclease RuvC